MGLFGTLLKGIGKVAKAGLSVATRGVSDKVIAVAKSLGKKPTATALKPKQYTEQETAAVLKVGQMLPRVRVTEVRDDVRSGLGQIGTYKRKSAYKAKRSSGAVRSAARAGSGGTSARALPAPRGRAAPARKSPPKKKGAGIVGGTVKRQPPPGGLDLAKMALAWRAADKPGTWQGWIRSNPIRRPK